MFEFKNFSISFPEKNWKCCLIVSFRLHIGRSCLIIYRHFVPERLTLCLRKSPSRVVCHVGPGNMDCRNGPDLFTRRPCLDC